ncbi:DMT family transporter [Chachezhania sediminis]|uniref:DMT family transporter n=1 Tax=Chachezhania sediminis TaxID=2599291 RepID=UPI00131D1A8C|nr:DMT family transporter [Chachezhania sediminis]
MEALTSHRPARAVGLYLSSIFLFSVMSAMVKSLSEEIPAGELVFFRSFFGFPPIIILLVMRGQLSQGLRTKRPGAHVWRGLVGTSSMALMFGGLGLIPLPEATAIGYAAPIFTVILAALLLGEKIRMIRISAVGVGLVGVLIMIWPRIGGVMAGNVAADMATVGALMVLGSTALRAVVQIHIRKMVKTENSSAIVFYFTLSSTVASLLTLPFGWVMPDWDTFLLMVLMGLLGGIGQILVTTSYRFGPASLIAPFDYSSMLFALVIGYVWFAEVPTLPMMAGAALVIAGNALVIWRERQLGLERSRANAVVPPKG